MNINNGAIITVGGQAALGIGTGAGTVILDGGTLDNSAGTGVLVAIGTIGGTGTILGNVTNQATVSPGNSPGTLSITGSYTQTATSQLRIELASASSFDKLVITGSAALSGILDVSLINGFLPINGQQFTILTAGNVVNNGLVLGGSAASSFGLLVNSTSVVLQATGAGLPGDYNHNGERRRGRLCHMAQDRQYSAWVHHVAVEFRTNLPAARVQL